MRVVPATDHLTYHLLTENAWREAQRLGLIAPESLATEGFVHCTDGWTELVQTANRQFAATGGPLIALSVDLARVRSPWRYDDARSVYPHVYGPVPTDAVVGIRSMPWAADGRFLPAKEVTVDAIASLLDRVDTAGLRIASARTAVESGGPWPVGAVAAGGGESEWGPTEVLAHVAEMLPYWLGEMERILAGRPGEPAHFGRTASDEIRTLSVARDATLPPRELFDRISAGVDRYRRRLPQLTSAEADRTGIHPTRGELSVASMLERFAVGHLEDHAGQLERALRD
jgi:uncharacterized protein (DUF952 family)